ncbi:glutaredoxin family protein [Georgenia sp. EYE_87]|uniref:glutaredoxin family protein n=1 Tax=Georgenia sp. EYE_87 TaxID=2853448 RepID=UPI0035A92BB5|nr:glutaredoxin family protein [Georgenia sp. EYE_87]
MLTIYGTPSCAACRLTRNVLERAGAPFQVVDLGRHPKKADEFRAAGHQALPVVEHAEQWWSGLQPDRLREAIALLRDARGEGNRGSLDPPTRRRSAPGDSGGPSLSRAQAPATVGPVGDVAGRLTE